MSEGLDPQAPLEFVRSSQRAPLDTPLRELIHQFSAGAATPAEHPPLRVFEEVLAQGAAHVEVHARLSALSHAGYLRGALVVLAAHLLERPDSALALRVAEELCDALDEQTGLALAGALLQLDAVRTQAAAPDSVFVRVHSLMGETHLHRHDHAAAAAHFDAILAVQVDHARALHSWTECVRALESRGELPRHSGPSVALLEGLEALELAGQGGLERYELGRPLGRGRHAVVYEAFDREVGRHVAIKRLLGQGARKDGVSDRVVDRHFFAEAQALTRVRSAHVVSLYEVQPRHRFVALELFRGGNLRVAMRRRRVGAAQLPRIGRELGLAMAAVHAAGAVHRDIKPANILLRNASPHAPTALADFGVAVTDGPGRSRAGTLRYLAPEVRRGQAAGPPADRFSAAVVLLELAIFPNALPKGFDRLGAHDDPRDTLDELEAGELLPWKAGDTDVWPSRLRRLLHPDPEARTW